jgi:hypothetical protein
MKRHTILIIIALVFSAFMACGSENYEAPNAQDTVSFSCISVNNDQACSGTLEGGVWNSGSVVISEAAYLNFIVSNYSDEMVSVMARASIGIDGCNYYLLPFAMVDVYPGTEVWFTRQLYNHRCGSLGDQGANISLYYAPEYDPALYPNPWEYPRTDSIETVRVVWSNIQ